MIVVRLHNAIKELLVQFQLGSKNIDVKLAFLLSFMLKMNGDADRSDHQHDTENSGQDLYCEIGDGL